MKKRYSAPRLEIKSKASVRRCANCGRVIFKDIICPACRKIMERAYGADAARIV